jgi:hypothetical protein
LPGPVHCIGDGTTMVNVFGGCFMSVVYPQIVLFRCRLSSGSVRQIVFYPAKYKNSKIKCYVYCKICNTGKAVISLPRYANTQIRKIWSDIALRRSYLKMTHLCICFVKKVFLLPQYADTHYKMTIFYLHICLFIFVAQIEGPFFVSFWNTSKCADPKKYAK